jgi:hypothetical protein
MPYFKQPDWSKRERVEDMTVDLFKLLGLSEVFMALSDEDELIEVGDHLRLLIATVLPKGIVTLRIHESWHECHAFSIKSAEPWQVEYIRTLERRVFGALIDCPHAFPNLQHVYWIVYLDHETHMLIGPYDASKERRTRPPPKARKRKKSSMPKRPRKVGIVNFLDGDERIVHETDQLLRI